MPAGSSQRCKTSWLSAAGHRLQLTLSHNETRSVSVGPSSAAGKLVTCRMKIIKWFALGYLIVAVLYGITVVFTEAGYVPLSSAFLHGVLAALLWPIELFTRLFVVVACLASKNSCF